MTDPTGRATGFPANPLAIELTVTHRRLWWRIDEGDEQPEHWDLSADISRSTPCPEAMRHVGDISILAAELGEDRNILDTLTVDDWALEFVIETVVVPPKGQLHPDLDAQLTDGPPRMLVLRDITLAEAWRGHNLGGPLLASTLRILAPSARLAVCRLSPTDFPGTEGDRVSAELASLRMGALLERIGFRLWRGVHILDLQNQMLFEARSEVFDRLGQPAWFGEKGEGEVGVNRRTPATMGPASAELWSSGWPRLPRATLPTLAYGLSCTNLYCRRL